MQNDRGQCFGVNGSPRGQLCLVGGRYGARTDDVSVVVAEVDQDVTHPGLPDRVVVRAAKVLDLVDWVIVCRHSGGSKKQDEREAEKSDRVADQQLEEQHSTSGI